MCVADTPSKLSSRAMQTAAAAAHLQAPNGTRWPFLPGSSSLGGGSLDSNLLNGFHSPALLQGVPTGATAHSVIELTLMRFTSPRLWILSSPHCGHCTLHSNPSAGP